MTLARNIAKAGYRVGFLDGAKIIKVRMYEGMRETWDEWGRSLDLKDATSRTELWGQLWLLTMVQGLPIPLTMLLFGGIEEGLSNPFLSGWLDLNVFLLLVRFGMLLAISGSYDRQFSVGKSAWLFWLSPFADPFAVARIFLSARQKPKAWRGRVYS